MERIALLPGGFKPPHAGHYNMAIWLAENTDAKTIVIKVGAKERDGVTREISLQLWNLYRVNDPNPTAKKLAILPSNSNSPVQDVYDFVEKEAPEDSTIYLGMGEKDINDKRFANIGKFAEPKGIKFETILVPPQAGGVSGTDMRKFIKSGDKESFLKYIPDFLPKEQKDRAWELVTGLEEDLYNPEDKVLDYMKSSEFKAGMPDGPKDDIEPSYKYKRGGVYGRMYNEEISPTDLNNIDTFADKQLDPVDVDLTSNHFFDRLNDPRNDKDISNAELIGFFKRLGKKKKDLLDFLTKYKEIVASDSRTDINIPFLKQADKIIAKTIMRKKDFQTSSPQLALERDLSDKEEKIAQDLPDKEFKKRYGKDWKLVKIATATKMAKKENYPPYKADQVQKVRYQASDTFTNSPKDAKKMGYLENMNPKEKAIVDDILSELNNLQEIDFSKIKEKLKSYGKKGLLTLSILLAITSSLQANPNMAQNIMDTGIEMIDSESQTDLYNAIIGLSQNLLDQGFKKSGDISSLGALKEVKIYYEALRDGKTSSLSTPGKTASNIIIKQLSQMSESNFKAFVDYGSGIKTINEGDTYEKMAAKGKKKGNLKQDTVRKRLKIKDGEKIPLSLINKEISRLKKMKNRSEKNQKYYKALTLAKTLKTTTHKENIDPKAQAKHKGKSAPYGSAYEPVNEADPKKGTGKKPKKSGRRLYTDENPKDTVKVKFSTRQDIVDTLNKVSFKNKSHARQSQVINLIHQRVRAALNRAKDPAVKKRLKPAFEYIKKRKEASKKKTQRMKKEGTFTKDWWKKIINEVLIVEGGAAGHMAHPFNLPNVNNGKSLLDVFKKSSDSLDKKPGAIKIDGVNSSIRLIDIDGKKQFVMDRGSKKELDLKGITKDDLLDRFGKGHGMVKIGGEVLDMFNEALPAIQNDLKKLGAFDDPNILFNMEYVSGKTNVQDYGSNFIAIHGLNKIESKEVQGKRGPLTKRVSSEVSYSKDDLQSLLDNLKPTAKKRGYEVYGSVPTTMNKKPNFNAALSKNYTVNAGESSETKSLGQWLNALDNIPEEDFIFMNVGYKTGSSTVNNKKVGAVSKQVYLAILNGENIDGLFDDAEDRKKAIQGFVTYLATEKLGDEVLKVLDSPMGSADKHEGVVIRDESIAKVPFKITGKFILGGMVSDF